MITGYALHQLGIDEPSARNWMFMPYGFAIEHGFDFEKYECVWEDDAVSEDDSDCNSFMEQLFYIFNMEHPAGFEGHSLSVSDIIELRHEDGSVDFFYVDDFGFTAI